MNRGSREAIPYAGGFLPASMRPRFMNRGSAKPTPDRFNIGYRLQ